MKNKLNHFIITIIRKYGYIHLFISLLLMKNKIIIFDHYFCKAKTWNLITPDHMHAFKEKMVSKQAK